MKPRNPGPEGNSTDPRSFINLKLFFGLCIRVAHIPEASVAFCLMEIRKKKKQAVFLNTFSERLFLQLSVTNMNIENLVP